MNRVVILGLTGACWVLFHTGSVGAETVENSKASIVVTDATKNIRLASSITLLPKFTTAALPMSLTADPIKDFYVADDFRVAGDLTRAVQLYIALTEEYPDTPQARAAGRRVDFLALSLSEKDLDEMEMGFPASEALKTVASKTVAQQFFTKRGVRLIETDRARAVEYFTESMELAWGIMQGELDDAFKSIVLEEYLAAAELTGEGEYVRTRLSEYADTIEPCFTSWLIKSVVDDEEPATDFVTTYVEQDAVKRHFVRLGRAANDDAERIEYFTKARDLSRQVLRDLDPDHPGASLTGTYLEASAALGEKEYLEAAADMESLLVTEELSIKRWAIRYELANYYVTKRRDTPEVHVGYAHFKQVISEATVELIDPVINDIRLDEWTRGIVMCTLGNAYSARGRAVEAKAHYDWVHDFYPIESHPGDSAELGRVEVDRRKKGADPVDSINRYKAFVQENPSGAWATRALLEVADMYERLDDPNGAREIYERIIQEYPNSSNVKIAKAKMLDLLP